MRSPLTTVTVTAATALTTAAVLLLPAAVPQAQAQARARARASGALPGAARSSAPLRAAAGSREYVEYTIAMDDIQVRGTLDPGSLAVTNTTSVRIPGTGPRSGWQATPTVSGNLGKGVTSIVRLPPEATGTVRLYADADEVRAAVDTTIGGRHSRWDRVLFTL